MNTPMPNVHNNIVLPLVAASVTIRALAQQALDAQVNYRGIDMSNAQQILQMWIKAQSVLNGVIAIAQNAERDALNG
jgi:hypothetical protein